LRSLCISPKKAGRGTPCSTTERHVTASKDDKTKSFIAAEPEGVKER
jgi:hypothetical protein